MKRTFLKTGLIAVCMVMTLGLLSACGAANNVGTWYVGDTNELFLNFEKDGNMSGYDPEIDLIYLGNWTENNGSYVVTGLSDQDLTLELTDKDTLYCYEYELTLKRGTANEIPNITVSELRDGNWITEDGKYELEFYNTEWDIYDDEFLEEGIFILEDGNLTMETTDGVQYQVTIAENRHEITVFDGIVFIKEE